MAPSPSRSLIILIRRVIQDAGLAGLSVVIIRMNINIHERCRLSGLINPAREIRYVYTLEREI